MQNKPITVEEEIEIVNIDFRNNLRLLRTSHGLSGVELSAELKMTPNRVHDLEEGRMPPKIDDLVRIIDFFDITFDDLLDQRLGVLIPSRTK